MSVVPFKDPRVKPGEEPKRPRIWVCNCRCEAFWLYEDGRIQCVQCDKFHDEMQGVWSFVVDDSEPA